MIKQTRYGHDSCYYFSPTWTNTLNKITYLLSLSATLDVYKREKEFSFPKLSMKKMQTEG